MVVIDQDKVIVVDDADNRSEYGIGSKEAFSILSELWLRSGWDTKYVYSFSWLGRPMIQLPEDMIRIQEMVYRVKPDVIVETGVAHGGSLVFYASLCKAMDHGRVIGIDVEIRPYNRAAIENHELFEYITLVEGSSIERETVSAVKSLIEPEENGLVVLDACHTRTHVLAELKAYSELVGVGSYIVAADGIMARVVGAPRSSPDWGWNNPKAAAEEFVRTNDHFAIQEPRAPFNEGMITERVTYWPGAFLLRLK